MLHPSSQPPVVSLDQLGHLLPALAQEFIEVSQLAIDTYLEPMYAPLTDEERQLKREALLAYCKQDTWAMVKTVGRMERGEK